MTIKDLFFTSRVFTISNILSLARIFLVIPVGYLIFYDVDGNYKYWALFVGLVMVLTDYLDGFFARILGQETPLGQYLDPIADKISIIFTLLILHLKKDYPLWIVIIIILRELTGTVFGTLLLTRRNIMGTPNYAGKAMVFAIALSGVWYLMDWPYKEWTIALVISFLFASVVGYFLRYGRIMFSRKS